jgi:hypothetical protein
MPALYEVETALRDAVAAAIYPAITARIYRGWPAQKQLDDDLRAGTPHVSIWPRAGMARITTRYPKEWVEAPGAPTAALTVVAAGITVTIGGTASAAQVVGVIVNGAGAYAYRCIGADTPTTVAAALAALIAGASSVGAVLTVPSAFRLVARAVIDAVALRELRRQEQAMQVTLWCPTPGSRDTIGALLDTAIAGLDFLAFPDGTKGRLSYTGSSTDDSPARELLFRRDLFVSVEYASTETATLPRVVAVSESIGASIEPLSLITTPVFTATQ